MVVLIALTSAFSLIAASLALQAWRKKFRRARMAGLELRENCLLTRYPIVFLSGPRSLFRLFDHWNDIPVFLREHGYQVIEIEATPQMNRAEDWVSAIETVNEKCHVIADSSLESAIHFLAESKLDLITSLTLVRNKRQEPSPLSRSNRIRATDLKPQSRAIEIYEIELITASSAVSALASRSAQVANQISIWLLSAHNLFGRKNRAKVDPVETGALVGLTNWPVELKFLDLAVALAERDAMGDR